MTIPIDRENYFLKLPNFFKMAIFRKLHVSFWKDEYIEGLNPDEKFLFLYLLTNDRTTQCGIYELTLKQMTFDTGFDVPKILSILEQFEKDKKLFYNPETKEIALKNWAKYNVSNSPKVISCIKKELKSVKDTVLIQYVYSMDTIKNQFGMCIDTHTQEEEEEEQEEEQEPNPAKFFPDKSLHGVDLDTNDFDNTIIYVETITKKKIEPREVERMWKAFKIQHFNGKHEYEGWPDVIQHFRDWLKKQVLNGKTEATNNQPVVNLLGGRKILTS